MYYPTDTYNSESRAEPGPEDVIVSITQTLQYLHRMTEGGGAGVYFLKTIYTIYTHI